TQADATRRARRLTLVAAAVLGVCVVAAALPAFAWPTSLARLALLLVPLLLPLPGLLRGQRRTYALASLCVTPYFIYGLTEVIAIPAVRAPAGAILFASLGWFVTLVNYLRATRPARAADPQVEPGT
ncbi:MAG: hypothetical protein QG586_256, partial [Pseudomonadota bacterium]|nr:hypothetical protein [Pseudomonadota bacterium]